MFVSNGVLSPFADARPGDPPVVRRCRDRREGDDSCLGRPCDASAASPCAIRCSGSRASSQVNDHVAVDVVGNVGSILFKISFTSGASCTISGFRRGAPADRKGKRKAASACSSPVVRRWDWPLLAGGKRRGAAYQFPVAGPACDCRDIILYSSAETQMYCMGDCSLSLTSKADPQLDWNDRRACRHPPPFARFRNARGDEPVTRRRRPRGCAPSNRRRLRRTARFLRY